MSEIHKTVSPSPPSMHNVEIGAFGTAGIPKGLYMALPLGDHNHIVSVNDHGCNTANLHQVVATWNFDLDNEQVVV